MFRSKENDCPQCEGSRFTHDDQGKKERCFVCVSLDEPPATASGSQRRNAGVSRVWENHRRKKWATIATAALEVLAFEGQPFTSDDIHERVGDPPTPNLLGAVFSRAAKSGIIARTADIKTSTRPTAHARRLPVWIGTQK